jgi:hypothetical protein
LDERCLPPINARTENPPMVASASLLMIVPQGVLESEICRSGDFGKEFTLFELGNFRLL